jgi:hypothetical protein
MINTQPSGALERTFTTFAMPMVDRLGGLSVRLAGIDDLPAAPGRPGANLTLGGSGQCSGWLSSAPYTKRRQRPRSANHSSALSIRRG